MRVMKFGGTSVGSAEAIAQVTRILADAYQEAPPVVAVVSAMSGVTNLLLDAAESAAWGHREPAAELQHDLHERHAAAAADAVRGAG